jgi:hypothetical protein
VASKRKPSAERAWKIAAINRMIADEEARISTLEARLPASSVAACRYCWNGEGFGVRKANPRCERCGGAGIRSHRGLVLGQLAGARKGIAELKKLKRRPGGLLTLAHMLRDARRLERLRQHPTGSKDVLAALEAEKQRIEARHGSVDAYFGHSAKQWALAKKARGKGDHEQVAVSDLIAALGKRRDEDGEPVPPRELWSALYAEIEAEFSKCEELIDDKRQPVYRYSFRGKTRTISYNHFRSVLSETRRRVAT